MNIPIHAPIPLRLLTKDGRWLLEVERYVSVRAQLFRPRRETLEGEVAILRALSAAEDIDLTDTARTLMRGGLLPERCYEVVEGSFAEAALPERISAPRPPEPRAQAEEHELMSLREQMLTLRAKVERLRAQVTELEQGAPHTRTSSNAPHTTSASNAPHTRTSSNAPHTTSASNAPHTTSASPAPHTASASPASHTGAMPPPALDLGAPKDHVAVLDALLRGAATFTESTADTTPGLLMIDESYFVSKLANESGECLGALLVDEPTLKKLGGAIGGLSAAETESELSRSDASDAVLGGLKDLAAVVVSTLAKNPANPALFACGVERLDPVELPWLFDVQKRVDLDDSLGGHVLIIGK